MMVIRNQEGDTVTNEKKTKVRWKEQFNKLLNEENKQYPLIQAASTERPVLYE